MAPPKTSSSAFVTAGTSKRSEKLTDQMRPVRFWHSRIASSCSSVVQPGLSTITSLPASIASMASAARSAGTAEIRIIRIAGSSRMRRRSATFATSGNVSLNLASVTAGPSVQ